jgi:hypothetical protein
LGSKFEKTITGFGGQIQSLVTYWDNVRDAANEAYTAQNRTPNVGGDFNLTDNTGGDDNKDRVYNPDDGCSMSSLDVKNLQEILNTVFGEDLSIDGDYGSATTAAVKRAQATIGAGQDGYYGPSTQSKMRDYIQNQWQANNNGSSMIGQGVKAMLDKLPKSYYAKGTMGTTRDQWAITDEPWLGDELTMYATPEGKLSYMRAGSTVIPADITANLVKWGKLNPDMMKVGGGANINMISNAVSKPNFELNFEALVKADRIDEGTLPEVKKFVQQEINNLVKQMNYALRVKGAR